ncbi:MAG: zinc dependent phospholipase C family protein [Bacteroidota bacterium]
MKAVKWLFLLLGLFLLTTSFLPTQPDWGFFAHRRINRLATFTLPPQLIRFYKAHIEFISAHATDPDMRRYVIPFEGQKHFIDLDQWYDDPLPLDFREVRRKFAEIFIINQQNDTLRMGGKNVKTPDDWNVILEGQNFSTFFKKDSIVLLREDYDLFFNNHVYNPQYFSQWDLNCDSLTAFFDYHGFTIDCTKAFAIDTFVQHGVLPYNLVKMQEALMYAMEEENLEKILRISADMGHYIGDAHVPLHTHSNYNGQKTDQIGIHAFWETRLPEMFADDTYDFLVGKAEYIEDLETHYWNIVEESHALVNDVLTIEKELSEIFPEDQQDCFIERGAGYIQKSACAEYATLYHEQLEGMVEKRFRAAIKAVGDAWYTAYLDAGQPDLYAIFDNRNKDKEKSDKEKLEAARRTQKIIGRPH